MLVIKSNTADSKNLKRQLENMPTSYRDYQLKTTGINMDKGGISRKRFPDNSEDLRNATGPYSQILRMDKSAKTFLNNEKNQLL